MELKVQGSFVKNFLTLKILTSLMLQVSIKLIKNKVQKMRDVFIDDVHVCVYKVVGLIKRIRSFGV